MRKQHLEPRETGQARKETVSQISWCLSTGESAPKKVCIFPGRRGNYLTWSPWFLFAKCLLGSRDWSQGLGNSEDSHRQRNPHIVHRIRIRICGQPGHLAGGMSEAELIEAVNLLLRLFVLRANSLPLWWVPGMKEERQARL